MTIFSIAVVTADAKPSVADGADVEIPNQNVKITVTSVLQTSAGRMVFGETHIFAGRGYVVVSYTPRGWWLSGGEIDTGP